METATDRSTSTTTNGTIVQVIGPVIDADFSESASSPKFTMRSRSNSIRPAVPTKLTLEVQQHLGEGWVRAIAMTSTEGLKRGMNVRNTGAPISVPGGRRRARSHFQRHRRSGGRTSDR